MVLTPPPAHPPGARTWSSSRQRCGQGGHHAARPGQLCWNEGSPSRGGQRSGKRRDLQTPHSDAISFTPAMPLAHSHSSFTPEALDNAGEPRHHVELERLPARGRGDRLNSLSLCAGQPRPGIHEPPTMPRSQRTNEPPGYHR